MWWIGALVGLALGLATEHDSALAYAFFGLIFGFIAKVHLDSKLDGLKRANMTLHEQAAAAMKELRATLASLEKKIERLEAELRASARASRAEAEAPAQEQTEIVSTDGQLAPSSTALQPEQPAVAAKTEAMLDTMQPTIVEPLASDLVLDETTQNTEVSDPLRLLELPQPAAETSAALSIPADHALATVEVPAPVEMKTIVPEQAPAIATKARARALPAPVPEKPWRERLPAPVADFIFGGNVLVKVGILILFLGLAFLLRYAAERVTVPVEMRYVGVVASGLALLMLGWRLRHSRRDYGLSLQGMAIGVFYLAALSAVKVHQLLTPQTALLFLLLVSVLSAALAVLQKAPVLAIVAALEGFVSPILTSTGENRPLSLMTYLAVLDIGIFLVAWFNAWRILNLIAFVGTFTLAVGWADKFYTPADYGLIQPFLIFFFVLFAVIGVLFARRTLLEAQHAATLEQTNTPLTGLKIVGRVDSALVFGNPLTAFALQYLLVKHTQYGAAFSALAIAGFYLLLARVIFSKQKRGLALLSESYLIVAGIFATLAIPLGLESTWTSAAWAVEGAGMFWLGCRQHRPYARAFAYLVMVGATYKLVNAISIVTTPGQPLFDGALLGPVLLGISAMVMWWINRRRPSAELATWEPSLAHFLPWLGLTAFTVLPWMLLSPSFATATCAVFGLLVGEIGRRQAWPEWRPIAATFQGGAVLSFLVSLHVDTSPQATAFLESGWRGMVPAIIIALSILLNAGRRMVMVKREAEAEGRAPAWTAFDSLASITGFALLHLSMLFGLDLSQVACIWPLTSVLVLFGALYMAQTPLAVFALFLQGLSAVFYLQSHQAGSSQPFFNWNFATQMSLSFAALLTADRMRHEAARMRQAIVALSAPDSDAKSGRTWLNPWCEQGIMQWLPLVWGVLWCLMGWTFEVKQALSMSASMEYLPSADLIVFVISSAMLLGLAAWRRWPQAGKLSAMQLPLYLLALAFAAYRSSSVFQPFAHGGWLAWAFAMTWYYFSLRKQENYYPAAHRLLSLQHIVGAWLILFVLTAELRAHVLELTQLGEAWVMLASVAVPALALFGLSRAWGRQSWPISTLRPLYLQFAAAPVAALLVWYAWNINLASAGDAAPLAYLPLLNPLEIALFLVGFTVFMWWRCLPQQAAVRLPNKMAAALFATTGFAVLTCAVLRAVHHYADVAWTAQSLFDSRLAQAAVSITWAITGVGLMILGNRRLQRAIWIAGAVLLAIVVAKLFLIELADRGGLYRIVSFIGVGLAFLVVGYFAPVPVKQEPKQKADQDPQQSSDQASARSLNEQREEGV